MMHINLITLLTLVLLPGSLFPARRIFSRLAPIALSSYALATIPQTDSRDMFNTDFGCDCEWRHVGVTHFGEPVERFSECHMHSKARRRKEKTQKEEEKLWAFYGTLSKATFTSIEIDAALQANFPPCVIESPQFSWVKKYITSSSLTTHDYYQWLAHGSNSYMCHQRVTLRENGHLCENEAECRRIHIVLGQQDIFACLRTLLMNRPVMRKELAKVKTQPQGKWIKDPMES